MIYQYEAIGPSSKTVRGAIDAESLRDAKHKLQKKQLFLLSVKEISAKATRSVFKATELGRFTRELARLVRAGLPLYESLLAMEEKYRGHKAERLLLSLAEQVRSGRPLSDALAEHPKTFDLVFVGMIANAEQAGNLGAALEELSALLAKQGEIRKQLMNAFLYPAFLLGFCGVVLSTLLFYVVPSLHELFEGRALHPMTAAVFWASQTLVRFKAIWLSAIALIGAAAVAAALHPRTRARLLAVWLRVPWLQGVFAKAALVRFCRAAATLLEGSVPIVEALTQASTVLRHPELRQSVEKAARAVQEGKPIDGAFQGQPLIPPLVPRMLGIAKESGNLSLTFRHLSEIYEDELERLLALFASVAQPALLLILGMIIGIVLLSVLIPLTDVSSFS